MKKRTIRYEGVIFTEGDRLNYYDEHLIPITGTLFNVLEVFTDNNSGWYLFLDGKNNKIIKLDDVINSMKQHANFIKG